MAPETPVTTCFGLSLAALLALGPACGDPSSEGSGEEEQATETSAGSGELETETRATETETETGEQGPDRDALIAELSAPGPYTVGFKELEISYMPPGMDEPRVLPVKLWYPGVEDPDAALAKYSLAGLVQLPNTSTLENISVAEDGPFPVVVYSHGSGGAGILPYPFAERFASHGWVLISADHVGNTVSSALNGNGLGFIQMGVMRPLDIRALLDALEDGLEGDEVAAASNLDEVFLFGHSFGGYTTFASGGVLVDYDRLLQLCSGEECTYLMDPAVEAAVTEGLFDPRIDALSPQAPALYSAFQDGAYGNIGIPTLLQSGRLDITTTHQSEAQPAWDALDAPDDVWLDLPAGGHYSFITICEDLDPALLALVQPSNADDGCGEQFTPVDELIPVLSTYMLGFAKRHVLGETDYELIFEGESLHPEIDLRRHE